MPICRIVKSQRGFGTLPVTDFSRDESLAADLRLCHGVYNSLNLAPNQLTETQSLLDKETIKTQVPFSIFFEGLRTNNTFINRMSDSFMVELLQLAKNKRITICLVKINHKNKDHCIPSGRWYLNFIDSLIRRKVDCEVEYSKIRAEEFQVLDTLKLAFNRLYLESGSLYELNVDSNNYREFLDYFNNYKVKSE